MDKQEILNLFIEETIEYLNELSNNLLVLENDLTDASALSTLFRSAHTLKGNATTAYNTISSFDDDEIVLTHIDKIGKLTHGLENLIMEVRDNGFVLTEYHIDLMFKTEEVLETLLTYVEQTIDEEVEINDLREQLLSSLEIGSNLTTKNEKIVESNDEKHESTQEYSKKDEVKGSTFGITLDCDPNYKHAFLSLVYKDIEDKYGSATFEPSYDELMTGNDFKDILVTLKSIPSVKDVTRFLKTIDNVDDAFLISSSEQTTKIETREVEEKITNKENNSNHDEETREKDEIVNIPKKEIKEDKTPSNQTTKKSKSFYVNSNIKVSTSRIDEVLKHVSSLVILKNKLSTYSSELSTNNEEFKKLKEVSEEISQTVDFLQESVMNIRMTPLDQLFGRFPKDVRNIAKEFGKKIKFEYKGGETEIDKSLLEQLFEPLMHLIRNSIYHGLETSEEREKAGKEPVGNLQLLAKHEQGMVVISVEDDGKGIDLEKVVNKAIEKGIMTEEKAKKSHRDELLNLIFHPGLSTADKVNNVAGRGVGMDAVRAKIEQMKGNIELKSIEGKGTKVFIQLPLTLAIIQAMLTKINNEFFAFPLSQVEEVVTIKTNELKHIANQEIYILREKEIPIIRLRNFFKIDHIKNSEEYLKLIIVKSGNKTIGVTVDEYIGQEDIVVKNVGQYLGDIPGIGGCNILGDGSISLIVDVNSLVKKIDKIKQK